MRRRTFLGVTAALAGSGYDAAAGSADNWMTRRWKVDSCCVLPRGAPNEYDGSVVGDPCIVWDDEVHTWRMFYFAGAGKDHEATPSRWTIAGMALSKSAEEVAPGDWAKAGPVPLADTPGKRRGHKFWVVMDPLRVNRAAKIRGRYWGLHVSGASKHIYAVSAERLAGPWTCVEKPILSPNTEGAAPDGKHCDTPTAFWFEDLGKVLIFYKAYPLRPQTGQPNSPFGSSSIVAYWRPGEASANKRHQILIPGKGSEFCRGWVGGVQLLRDSRSSRWYALLNGSPTPPEDTSNREPPPSLGGWAICKGADADGTWEVDAKHSPILRPDQLTATEVKAGMGVNFWRHHLLVTPTGRARIFFNSGKYGTEQMYSMIAEPG